MIKWNFFQVGKAKNIRNQINIIYHINRLKKKSHMLISVGAEEALDQNPITIHDKNSINMEETQTSLI